MTQSKYTEKCILAQIFLGLAGIWVKRLLGPILGQEEGFHFLANYWGYFSLSGEREEGMFGD